MSDLALQIIEEEKINKTGKLDLGKSGLTDIPDELFELPWLEELSLSNKVYDKNIYQWVESPNSGAYNYIDIKKLPESFKRLTKLKRFSFASDSEKSSSLSNCDILSDLTNLRILELSSNQISDTSFLKRLKKLQYLSVSNNKISDTSFLEKMTSLEHLSIANNPIDDYNFLKKITSFVNAKLKCRVLY